MTWSKVGSPKLPATAVSTEKNTSDEIISTLKITGIIGYYKGYYFCSINNSAGTTHSVHVYLSVTGKIIELNSTKFNLCLFLFSFA